MFLSNTAEAHHTQVDVAVTVLQKARSSMVHQSPVGTSSNLKLTHGDVGMAESAPIVLEDDPIVPILLQRAGTSLEACESYETRLDLYAEAAERGSAEALYKWALLVKQGSEVSNTACGVDSDGAGGHSDGSAPASTSWGGIGISDKRPAGAFEHERATLAMLFAADLGHAPALVSLAFTLLTGHGVEPMLQPHSKISTDWAIPVHPAFTEEDPATGRRVYRQSVIQTAISEYLSNVTDCTIGTATPASCTFDLSGRSGSVTDSVLVRNLTHTESTNSDGKNQLCPDATALAIGLLQVAAVHRVAEAHQALAHRSVNVS